MAAGLIYNSGLMAKTLAWLQEINQGHGTFEKRPVIVTGVLSRNLSVPAKGTK